MAKVLVSWIGNTDLNAPAKYEETGLGPVAQAVADRPFDEIVLLNNYSDDRVPAYIKWLQHRTQSSVLLHNLPLSGPTNFSEIYQGALGVVSDVTKRHGPSVDLTFHLSPGTSQMAAVWVILSKTRFPAELIESSPQYGVKTCSFPFEISAEYIPDLLRKPDQELERLSAGLPPDAPEFADIIHRSPVMKRVIARARRVAPRSVSVLIEGESGTGKELLARAIHKASPRSGRDFVPVNCGAIPQELLQSELFGHEAGAFTGATRKHRGYFEAADGGTLFLDEVGELPLSAQVKILRALQESEIVPVGSTKPIKINVRIIAATNRTLIEEVASGNFRADLFYRLAVVILKLPPLRERPGDLNLLIDRLLDKINQDSSLEPGHLQKKISIPARNLLLAHSWPGNVRELLNTLLRAAIWSPGATIGTEEVRDALLPMAPSREWDILNRPLGDGFNLPELIRTVAQHYLSRAMDEAGNNKTKAAELLGLPSYQTLTNWLKKHNIKK